MCAAWTVIGPTATAMRDDVEAALETNDELVRDAVQEGVEDAPAIEIPVAVGNSYAAIKQVIADRAERKRYREATESEALRRFTRACDAILGRSNRGPSPLDVAELMQRLEQRTNPGESLTLRDIEHGLSELPADRLLPDEKVTVSKMFSALLSANEPLGRAEIIDRAGVSESSYDRNWQRLAAIGLVERTDEKQWRAWIDPWWADVNDQGKPRKGDVDVGPLPSWDSALYEAALELDLEVATNHDLWCQPMFEEIVTATGLSEWRALVAAYSDRIDRTYLSYSDPSRVQIGRWPTGAEESQERLSETGGTLSAAD